MSVALVWRIAIASFVLAALCGCAGREHSSSALTVPKPPAARELRVMTFNRRVRTILDGPNIWDRRRDCVVERIRAFEPDLLGTQEGLDSMETDLRLQLADYTFLGVGRSDGKHRGEMSAIFFRTGRFEMLDAGHFWLVGVLVLVIYLTFAMTLYLLPPGGQITPP